MARGKEAERRGKETAAKNQRLGEKIKRADKPASDPAGKPEPKGGETPKKP